jgi:chromosome segregation ATPase
LLQSILFFILGFLCSGFLALMVAPAIWRRAVTLTRRRIEASVPLSLAEIQAEKDRMRAEMAMTIRRLEMSVKSLREKAAAQAVEIGRGHEELKRLSRERDERNDGLSQSETKAGELEAELKRHHERSQDLAGKLAEAEEALKTKTLELERVSRLYDEASFDASSRQIELVARESEVENLSGELTELRAVRTQAEQRRQQMEAEIRSSRQALEEEKQRADRLERENARLAASLDQPAQASNAGPEDGPETALPGHDASAGERGDDAGAVLAELTADRDRLQERLDETIRENRRLKERSIAREGSVQSAGIGGGQEDALLREQMTNLAAEVIRLAARLEGPDSPIDKALSGPAAVDQDDGDPGRRITSLADRVRALQRAAAAQ